MKKDVVQVEIEIPSDVNVEVNGLDVKMTGPKGTLEKRFKMFDVELNKEDNKLIVKGKKMMVHTLAAHLHNMIHGVREGFEKKMKMVYSHFPINLEIKDGYVYIKNFMGEKYPRKVRMIPGVEIDIKAPYLYIRGIDKEAVGQMAASLRSATKIRKLDNRVFQDGIYYAID